MAVKLGKISQNNKLISWRRYRKMHYEGFGLYSECGILMIEHRIIMRKLLYLEKILNMPDSRLVRMVYNEQKRLGRFGIMK